MIVAPQRAEIASRILREMCRHETLFTDYEKACADACMECEQCEARKRRVVAMLLDPRARVWEVWSSDDVVGILYITDVILGCDAVCHYLFFDGRLKDKTQLLEGAIQWAFTEHPGWPPLKRLTVTVPSFAYALARHASKYLGFGGPYTYRNLCVEGVKRNSILWKGQFHDMLIMGRLNN